MKTRVLKQEFQKQVPGVALEYPPHCGGETTPTYWLWQHSL